MRCHEVLGIVIRSLDLNSSPVGIDAEVEG